jgi:hypothetical protein
MQRYISTLGHFYTEGETPPETPPPKTFTQDEVNTFLAEERRKAQKQFEEVKKTASNADLLAKKLKEMESQYLTKEQLAAQAAEEAKTQHETEVKRLQDSEVAWKGRFEQTIVSNAISSAALKHNAYDAEQLGLIIGPMTRVVEKTDDKGQGTGVFQTVTSIEIDGKKLELPTAEAVEKLRASGRYPNQFKVNGQPGTGFTMNNDPTPQTGELKPGDTLGIIKMYQEGRKAGKF